MLFCTPIFASFLEKETRKVRSRTTDLPKVNRKWLEIAKKLIEQDPDYEIKSLDGKYLLDRWQHEENTEGLKMHYYKHALGEFLNSIGENIKTSFVRVPHENDRLPPKFDHSDF